MNPDYEQAKRMALENVVQKRNRKAVYDFQCRHAGKHCNRKRNRKQKRINGYFIRKGKVII